MAENQKNEEKKKLNRIELYERIYAILDDNSSDTASRNKAYESIIKLIESSELQEREGGNA